MVDSAEKISNNEEEDTYDYISPFSSQEKCMRFFYDYVELELLQWIGGPVCVCILRYISGVQLCVTLWAVAHQAPLSIGFSRQEYWHWCTAPP